MESLDTNPVNADENNALVDAPEVDSEAAESEGAETASAAAETSKSGKPAHSAELQERFDKLTREKYEGLSRAERAEYRAQELERRLAELEQVSAKPQTVAPSDAFPTLESVGFDTDAHAAAVAEWAAKQARQAAKAEIEAERTVASRQQAQQNWERTQAAYAKSKPDYMEKVGTLPPSLMTDALAAEIMETGNPEIAYYLAENVEKLAEIAKLPPKAQAREIGRIEARLEAAKTSPPPVSKAPPPLSKIDGKDPSSSVSTTDPASDKLSDDEWVKAEQRRMARRRK